MKYLLLVLILLSPSAYATDLILGGWSSHGSQSEYEKLNEVHYALGVIFENGLTVVTFKNSFYKQSGVVGYTKEFSKFNHGKYSVSTSVTVGVVTGYSEEQAEGAWIGGGASMYLLPTLTIGYDRFKIDTGISIAFNKPLITNNFRYTF